MKFPECILNCDQERIKKVILKVIKNIFYLILKYNITEHIIYQEYIFNYVKGNICTKKK